MLLKIILNKIFNSKKVKNSKTYRKKGINGFSFVASNKEELEEMVKLKMKQLKKIGYKGIEGNDLVLYGTTTKFLSSKNRKITIILNDLVMTTVSIHKEMSIFGKFAQEFKNDIREMEKQVLIGAKEILEDKKQKNKYIDEMLNFIDNDTYKR